MAHPNTTNDLPSRLDALHADFEALGARHKLKLCLQACEACIRTPQDVFRAVNDAIQRATEDIEREEIMFHGLEIVAQFGPAARDGVLAVFKGVADNALGRLESDHPIALHFDDVTVYEPAYVTGGAQEAVNRLREQLEAALAQYRARLRDMRLQREDFQSSDLTALDVERDARIASILDETRTLMQEEGSVGVGAALVNAFKEVGGAHQQAMAELDEAHGQDAQLQDSAGELAILRKQEALSEVEEKLTVIRGLREMVLARQARSASTTIHMNMLREQLQEARRCLSGDDGDEEP